MPTPYTTGPVRIVWGNPQKAVQKLDQNNNNQPVFKDGKPVMQWKFMFAVPKAEFTPLWAVMCAEGARIVPSMATGQVPAGFALKMHDGDGMDSKGKPFANREGQKGCYVITASSESFPPRIVRNINGAYADVPEGKLKCGDWVRVALNVDAHGAKTGVAASKSGLYMNPQMIELIGEGDEIFSGIDPNDAFGGQTVALPPGARPIGSAPSVPTTAAPLPVQAGPGAPAPIPFAAPVAAPVTMSPVAPVPAMPGMPALAPIAFPSSVAPALDFIPLAAPPAIPVAPPAIPVAPVAKPQFSIPAGSAMPPGYVYVGPSADQRSWIIQAA